MKRDEGGYIVVETIGTFVPFVLLVISILSLVNIVTVQARVHYAMTQAAQTLSMYCYTLQVTGAAEHLMGLDHEAGKLQVQAADFQEDLNGILEGMESLSPGDVGRHGESAFKRSYGWAEDTIKDPKETIRLLLDYGLNEGRGALAQPLVRSLVGRYLANGDRTGDEFLRAVHVIDGLEGLEFYDSSLTDFNPNNSVILDQNGDVKLVVRYDIDYSFGALPLPFGKLHVTQTVKTRAWLGGSEEGYSE